MWRDLSASEIQIKATNAKCMSNRESTGHRVCATTPADQILSHTLSVSGLYTTSWLTDHSIKKTDQSSLCAFGDLLQLQLICYESCDQTSTSPTPRGYQQQQSMSDSPAAAAGGLQVTTAVHSPVIEHVPHDTNSSLGCPLVTNNRISQSARQRRCSALPQHSTEGTLVCVLLLCVACVCACRTWCWLQQMRMGLPRPPCLTLLDPACRPGTPHFAAARAEV
jgi:hypothetical protein